MRRNFLFFLFSSFLLGICVPTIPHTVKAEEVISSSVCQPPALPHWTYDRSNLFPKDQPLARPKDGTALPDGRLIVADQPHGLLLIEKDGNVPNPPDLPAAPNGVFLEHDKCKPGLDIYFQCLGRKWKFWGRTGKGENGWIGLFEDMCSHGFQIKPQIDVDMPPFNPPECLEHLNLLPFHPDRDPALGI